MVRLAILTAFSLFLSVFSRADIPVYEVQRAILDRHAAWTAGANKFTQMSAEERRYLTGALPINPADISPQQILTLPEITALPDSFDWRDADGNWMTPVKDQGACGSCWAFSALGQLEAWWKIRGGDPNAKLDLSEQFLLSCSDAGNCEEGGWMHQSLEFAKTTGIAFEADLPYRASSNIPCTSTKAGWESHAITIPDWGYITLDKAHVDNIKNAVFRHPLSVSYEVFDDFFAYKTGVYEHVYGESAGWHAVVIVGWNDREQSWLVKNSWGAGWGEHGYFRIKWGDSSMGAYSPFIWDENATATVYASTSRLNIGLTYGDIDSAEFYVHNAGPQGVLFYASESTAEQETAAWLTLKNSAGYLAAGDSAQVKLVVNTRGLAPGIYNTSIELLTNTAQNRGKVMPVVLELRRPDYDARLNKITLPETGLPLLGWSSLSAEIENIGAKSLDLAVVCAIRQNDKMLLLDTCRVSSASGAVTGVNFRVFKPRETGRLDCAMTIIDAPQDYNDFNNRLEKAVNVTHSIENFEGSAQNWRLEGGWSCCTTFNGHAGPNSAHVNGGIFPYPDNMKAPMTWSPGFELEGLDSLFVTFWTRYVTADANDMCFVETSGDNQSWETVDAFTGVHPGWERRVINLTDYAQQRRAKAWIRFRFVSDASGGSIGVLIDDLEVFTGKVPPVKDSPNQTIVAEGSPQPPGAWQLWQNYPNPFNGGTTIRYQIGKPAWVLVSLFSLDGRLVERLTARNQEPGEYVVNYQAENVASGIYFLQMQAFSEQELVFQAVRKMTLFK